MKIKTIAPEEQNIALALGISKERERELDELLYADLSRITKGVLGKDETPESVTDQMERLTQYCNHPNETAYVCFSIGAKVGQLKALSDMGPLGLIGMLMGGKKDDD